MTCLVLLLKRRASSLSELHTALYSSLSALNGYLFPDFIPAVGSY